MSVEINARDLMPGSNLDLTKLYGRFANYTITGDLLQNTTIRADGDIYISGDVSDHARVYATGLVHVGGVIGDHTVLHGSDINAKNCGSNNDFEARKGDIALLNLSDHNHLKAKGFITLEEAGNYLHATINSHGSCQSSELAFGTTGHHAILKAPYVRGTSVGNDSLVIATEDNVGLNYIGDNSKVLSAAAAVIKEQGSNVSVGVYVPRKMAREAAASPYSFGNGFTPQGMGVYFNVRQKRYVITEETLARCGSDDTDAFIDALGKHAADMKTETVVAENGSVLKETSFSLPKDYLDQQAVRKHIRNFMNAHRIIGES